MNYESYCEQPKLVTISQEVLISILEENRGLKEKVNELENIIGNLSRKCQKERHKNKQLKTMLYNAGRLVDKENNKEMISTEELKTKESKENYKTQISKMSQIWSDEESSRNELNSVKNSIMHCK